ARGRDREGKGEKHEKRGGAAGEVSAPKCSHANLLEDVNDKLSRVRRLAVSPFPLRRWTNDTRDNLTGRGWGVSRSGNRLRPNRLRRKELVLLAGQLGVARPAARAGRGEALPFDQPDAAVPAQDRIVVTGGPRRLGPLVPLHRLAQSRVDRIGGRPPAHQRARL